MEYTLNDPDINCATVAIMGKYPDKGYCINEKYKELIYVIQGSGTLNKKDEVITFEKGEVILIGKGEVYFWNA